MPHNQHETEEAYLKSYDPTAYQRASTSVDSVIYSIIDGELHVLIAQRNEHPFKDRWALVGGYIDLEKDKTLEDTATRKLAEKTGIKTPYLEQLYTIGNAERDPRGWSVTTVYFALIASDKVILKSGGGAKDTRWEKITNGEIGVELAFDHNVILYDSTQRLKSKVLYTSLPLYLMPEKFTLNELQNVYEVVMGEKMDTKSFRRRILNANLVKETKEMKETGRRPAMLYTARSNEQPHFFTRNIEGAHNKG